MSKITQTSPAACTVIASMQLTELLLSFKRTVMNVHGSSAWLLMIYTVTTPYTAESKGSLVSGTEHRRGFLHLPFLWLLYSKFSRVTTHTHIHNGPSEKCLHILHVLRGPQAHKHTQLHTNGHNRPHYCTLSHRLLLCARPLSFSNILPFSSLLPQRKY